MFLCTSMVWITAFDQPRSHVEWETFRLLFDIFFSSQSESCPRSPPRYHSQRSWLLSLGCALVLFGFGVTASALIMIAVHPELNDLSINRTRFYKQRPKNIGPQTSDTVCGSHPHSLNGRSKCGLDNSARNTLRHRSRSKQWALPFSRCMIDINCWPNYSHIMMKYVKT